MDAEGELMHGVESDMCYIISARKLPKIQYHLYMGCEALVPCLPPPASTGSCELNCGSLSHTVCFPSKESDFTLILGIAPLL